MLTEHLTVELIKVLKILKEKGGTDCTGTCHHRKPGEFHCHTLGAMIHISSAAICLNGFPIGIPMPFVS
jgi:hypothetical protein